MLPLGLVIDQWGIHSLTGHFRIGQLSSVQSVRFFARKQKVKKTLDDLFQETSEMITEKFMKKFNTTVQQVEPKVNQSLIDMHLSNELSDIINQHQHSL